MKIYTLFWFDVEDYITPESDEALKGLLEIFEVQGVQATWKLVGEKARSLSGRGRRDVIKLLQRQDLGYHTDYHSVHPVLAEYLDDMGWEDGIAELDRRETKGYEDLCRLVGPASTFGQAGGSWAPQIYPLMKKWEIPLFMDEAGHIGLDGRPFWYCGVLHINRMGPNCTRMDFRRGAQGLEDGKQAFDALRDRLSESGGLISIYYHPCEFATTAFWDGVNFARGANPQPSSWRPAPVLSLEQRRQALAYFAGYLSHVRKTPGVELLNGRQAAGLLPDLAQGRSYPPQRVAGLAAFADGDITYVEDDGTTLSPAELFHLVVDSLCDLQAGSDAADNWTTPYGPTRRVQSTLKAGTSISTAAFLGMCRDVQGFMAAHGRLPDRVYCGVDTLSPADFLLTAVDLLTARCGNGDFPPAARVRHGRLALEHHVCPDSWGWVIFPEGFRGAQIIELARLQAWTLKPALLRA